MISAHVIYCISESLEEFIAKVNSKYSCRHIKPSCILSFFALLKSRLSQKDPLYSCHTYKILLKPSTVADVSFLGSIHYFYLSWGFMKMTETKVSFTTDTGTTLERFLEISVSFPSSHLRQCFLAFSLASVSTKDFHWFSLEHSL